MISIIKIDLILNSKYYYGSYFYFKYSLMNQEYLYIKLYYSLNYFMNNSLVIVSFVEEILLQCCLKIRL